VQTYLCIDAVDQLDGFLDVPTEDGVPYLDTLFHALQIEGLALVDVRLLCKFLGGTWVSFGDEVVHNHQIDITVADIVS